MNTITFRVYGVAQPKGNMQAYTPKGMKFPIVTESNRNVRSWSQLVAEAASHALNDTAFSIQRGPVHIVLRFYLPRPKAIGGKLVPHLKRPDVDKLSRAVLDALTGVVYHDDAQVVDLSVSKAYAVPHESPCLEVVIRDAIGFVQATDPRLQFGEEAHS